MLLPSQRISSPSHPLLPFLGRQGFVVLDGGLATALEARGHQLDDSLWSARLLRDDPEAIAQVHLDFLRAGADVITTASYQASFEGFAAAGLSEAESQTLMVRSVSLAQQAVERWWTEAPSCRQDRRRPLVAASVGPYGAFLADGSEYRGDYDIDASRLMAFHGRRLDLLAHSGADLLACETIPSRLEARILTRLLAHRRQRGKTTLAWLSFCCRDDRHLADGSSLAEVVAEVAAEPSWLAIGVNCTAPRHIGPLLDALRLSTDKPAVAYPNAGESWDAETKRWLPPSASGKSTEAAWGPWALDWWRRGARLVGGCCRATPQDIGSMRRYLLRHLKVQTLDSPAALD